MKNEKKPTYLKWLLTEHKAGPFKLLLTIVGIVLSSYITPVIIEEYNYYELPLYPAIMGFVASYGFTIGITLQPVSIYKRMVQMRWWDRGGK